jgi:hypothetical protein
MQVLNTNGADDTNDTDVATISIYIRNIRLLVSFVTASVANSAEGIESFRMNPTTIYNDVLKF